MDPFDFLEDDDYGMPALGSSREPVPRRGRNPDFDRHFANRWHDLDPSDPAYDDMREAEWRTWRVPAPTAQAGPSRRQYELDDDEQLARALAESAAEHEQRNPSAASRPESRHEDEDAELRRVLELSKTQTRGRSATPDDERMQYEQAVAASLGAAENPVIIDDDVDDTVEPDSSPAKPAQDARLHRRLPLDVMREDSVPRSAASTLTSGAPSRPASAGAPPSAAATTGTGSASALSAASTSGSSSTGGVLGGLMLDRRQLEQERLARQAARASQKSSAAPSPTNAVPSSSSGTGVATAAGNAQAGPSRSSTSSASLHPLQSRGPFPSDAAGEYYLDGELRHTRLVIGKPSSAPTFSFRDVIGDPSQTSLLIHSSFVFDDEWLDESRILPLPEMCPTIRICRPLGPTGLDATKSGKLQMMMNGEVHCYPKLSNGRGSEHMKFAWIFYKTGRLRVMIGTANEVDYDWERIENTIFVQDFLPLGSSQLAPSPHDLPDFPTQFRWLFANLKVNKALAALRANHPFGGFMPFSEANDFADLAKYDWSRVRVRVVMSVAGYYTGPEDMVQFGLPRLAHVLDEEGWKPRADEQVTLEYQGSSLGSYTSEWLNHFHRSASGLSLNAIRDMPKGLSLPPVKVVFPSLATVDNSISGRPGGGTMFCGQGYSKQKGTDKLFHDANSKSGGVLMHSKVLVALFQPKPEMVGFPKATNGEGSRKRKIDDVDSARSDVGGWVYVGSHNFTPSAWGYVKTDRRPPTLSIANFEMGIVFPLPREDASAAADLIAPHIRPPRKYTAADEPWDQRKYMQ